MPKILIDTDIYIHFLRRGHFKESIKALYTFRTRDIHFSSVVIKELLQRVLDAKGRSSVEILYKPFEKAERIVTPTHTDWVQTGNLLSQMRKKRKELTAKISRLTHDTLIALCAKRIGAVLYTCNQKDFQLLSEMLPFQYQPIVDGHFLAKETLTG